MSMLNSFFPYYFTVINLIHNEAEITEIQERRIAECIQKWKDAKNLPRKQKKAVRKKMNIEYNFHMSLKEYRPNLFNFNL